MKAKRWTIILLVIVLMSIVCFGTMTYILDPMLRYHSESGPLSSYEYVEMYSNPGIARNYDYDSVMVGTSMIENTDVDLCDKLWDVNMVRLPYSGGTTYNMKTILDVAFRNNDHIKNVYWELDEFQLFGSATKPRYPLPEYMYEDNHRNDLKYLLNLDIFYHYTIKDIINTLRGNEQNMERRGITLTGNFGEEQMLATYTRPSKAKTNVRFSESKMKDSVDANLENLVELIKANPNTQFSFFMVPFSVLYWDNEVRQGTFDAVMDGVEYAIEELIQYENVNVYFYQAEEDIITNLNNYKDYSHYGNWINDTITNFMAEGKNKITKTNYKQMIGELRSFVHSYDFDSLFQ